MTAPTDLQTATSAIQWTNGRQLVTGAMVSGLFSIVIAILSGMGTWSSTGFTPNIAALSIAGAQLQAGAAAANLGTASGDLTGSFPGPLTVSPLLSGTAPRTLAQIFDATYATTYGVVCDATQGVTGSGTDNTTPLQNAWNASQTVVAQGDGRKLVLPTCLAGAGIRTGPIVDTGQVDVEGASNFSTLLILKDGSNAPLISVSPSASYNFVGDGHPQGQVDLRRLRITSEDTASAAATYPNAAGLGFTTAATNPLGSWVRADDIVIYNMPGAGVSANAYSGFVHFNRLYVKGAGGACVTLTNMNDSRFDHPDLSSCGGGGFNETGGAQTNIYNPNIYSNTGNGVTLNNAPLKIVGGVINLNGGHGLSVNNTSPEHVSLEQTSFGSNSSASPGTSSDIYVAASARAITLLNTQFYTTPSASTVLNNINFATTGTYVDCSSCYFAAGAGSSLITNAPNQLDAMADEGGVRTVRAPLQVVATKQYTGFTLGNGVNPLLLCQGNTAANASGSDANDSVLCQFMSGGSPVVQISTLSGQYAPVTYFNSDLYLGNNSTSGAPIARNLWGTGGAGTNIAGATLTMYGGPGTGSGNGGDAALGACPPGASGTTPNACAASFKVNGSTGLPQVVRAPVTVASLPPCAAGLLGSFAIVLDATSPTYNGALTGGGNVRVPAWCTSSGTGPTYAWTAH